jgi:hypothetical protein
LRIELARQFGSAYVQCVDLALPLGRLLLRGDGVVGDHQAMLTPAGFLNDLTRCVGHLGLHGLQDFGELAITPPRHRQDELHRLAAGQLQLRQGGHIVQRQQASVGHDDQTADVRIPFEQGAQHG